MTDRWYDASNPVFSNDGKYLFFSAATEYQSNYSRVEWNASYSVGNKLFVLPLASDTPNPAAIKSDEYSPKDNGDTPSKDKEKEITGTKVDVKDMAMRITMLPLSGERGSMSAVAAVDDNLYFRSSKGMRKLNLKTMQVDDSPMPAFMAITPDYKKVLVRTGGHFKVINFGAAPGKGPSVPDDDLYMTIDHKAEWKQIFDESWRITRDGFYVENMHGADWNHVYEKYAQMLPYVNHRDDLTYLIGEMLGELNVGHAYITSGEKPEIPRIATGLLGARYSKDSRTGAFKIEKIFNGATWVKGRRLSY